jgi:hypothetical protein
MKYIAKMMLALLASVTLVIPAYAWDFGASGSMSTTWNQTTIKKSSDADAVASSGFGSDAGAITMSSSNSDGDNTASLSYKLDWDGNLDEIWTLSGSSKVGKWTASSSIDYNNDDGAQAAADAPALTLADGTMTIVMGSASHIGSASKGSGDSVASGEVQWQALDDYDIGAAVDSFQGLSIGYKLDDTSSVTVALQMGGGSALGIQPLTSITTAMVAGSDTVDLAAVYTAYNALEDNASYDGLCGDVAYTGTSSSAVLTATTTAQKKANACYATWAATSTGQNTISYNTTASTASASTGSAGNSGFGLTYGGTFDTITVDFAYGSATGKSTDKDVKNTTAASTMSVAVGMDMGDIAPYLTYANYQISTNTGAAGAKDAGVKESGIRVGTTVALGDDSVGLEYTTTSATGLASGAKTTTETGIEVGYATTVGPATLSVGYGTYSITADDSQGPYRTGYAAAPASDYAKGGTMSDIEVKMAYSF